MAWQFATLTLTTSSIITLGDFQAIQTDLQNFGGNVDAGGYGLTNASFLGLVAGALPGTTYAVAGATWTSGVATLTIGTHQISVNQFVSVSSVTPTGYNVSNVMVSAITSISISFLLASNPGAYSSGGLLIVGAAPGFGTVAIDPTTVLRIYNGSAWVTGGGPPGNTGPSGPPGSPGGATGATGAGSVGATGATGAGSVGATGASGSSGSPGSPGGATGATGSQGNTGSPGGIGNTGPAGVGATGATGAGSVGATGAAGVAYTTTVTGILTQTINQTTHLQGTTPVVTAWDTNGNQVQPEINNSGAPSAPTGNILLTFGPNTFTGLIVISGSGAGVAGINGATGPSGSPGGATGATGSQGIQGIPGTSGTNFGTHIQFFTATQGQTSFTPSAAPAEPCLVYKNGLLQQHGGADYAISGVLIQFVNSLQAGDLVATIQ